MRKSLILGLGLAVVTPIAIAVVAGTAYAADATLTVNVGTVVRPVTHVAAGGLYGVDTGSTNPSSALLNPLRPRQFTQPPPGTKQTSTGCCNALGVNAKLASAGAHQYIRMPDIYAGFPYPAVTMADWTAKVDTMVQAKLDAGSGASTVNGWEIWNEPDWTWPSSLGSYFNGWTTTYNRIRTKDKSTPIVGPGYAIYNHQWMLDFFTNAKNTNTLPAVAVWHELDPDSYLNVQAHVNDFRALENSLGIGHRPISINEYATAAQVDQPSIAVHYMSVFERAGIDNAERAFWYEPGTLNGLVYNNQPTASYWAYKWYGDQSGNIVQTSSNNQWLDGVASYNAGTKQVNIIFGEADGNNTLQINGLGALGTSTVHVQISSTNTTGRATVQSAPNVLWNQDYTLTNGNLTLPIYNMTGLAAYQVLITAA